MGRGEVSSCGAGPGNCRGGGVRFDVAQSFAHESWGGEGARGGEIPSCGTDGNEIRG